jgi:hypothetical protein
VCVVVRPMISTDRRRGCTSAMPTRKLTAIKSPLSSAPMPAAAEVLRKTLPTWRPKRGVREAHQTAERAGADRVVRCRVAIRQITGMTWKLSASDVSSEGMSPYMQAVCRSFVTLKVSQLNRRLRAKSACGLFAFTGRRARPTREGGGA